MATGGMAIITIVKIIVTVIKIATMIRTVTIGTIATTDVIYGGNPFRPLKRAKNGADSSPAKAGA